MTVATIVCLTASFCVNPSAVTLVAAPAADRTSVCIVADQSLCPTVALPIAEVLRLLDQGPVAVTFVPEPKT